MRQRNKIDNDAGAFGSELSANYVVESLEGKELRDGEAANRNGQARTQQPEFIVHPSRTIADLIGRGNTIATTGRFPGKTSADGGKIDRRSYAVFIHAAEFFEPAK